MNVPLPNDVPAYIDFITSLTAPIIVQIRPVMVPVISFSIFFMFMLWWVRQTL